MGVRQQLRTLEFLYRFLSGRADGACDAAGMERKLLVDARGSRKRLLKRAAPESLGVESARVAAFLEALGREKKLSPHGCMVLRGGRVIAEASYAPYDRHRWHVVHSMAKTVTGLAVGMAVKEGLFSLDDKLSDIFGEPGGILSKRPGRAKDAVTVRHLLEMRSGVAFHEEGLFISGAWRKDFLSAGLSYRPGSRFQYNSMNSYMLSAVIKETSGQGLNDFLEERLWRPLGMQKPYWQKGPEGLEAGGWGLYLRLEEAALLGQLLLQRGRLWGRRLVPAGWIDYMAKKNIDTPSAVSRHGYGAHLWPLGYGGGFQANGMLGQNLYVLPRAQMVIAVTAGAEEFFPNSRMNVLVERYFGGDYAPGKRLQPAPFAYTALRLKKSRLGRPQAHPPAALKLPDYVRGRTYELPENTAGILPLFLQCMHTSFSGGIRRLSFVCSEGREYLQLVEGESCVHIPLSEKKPARLRMKIGGRIFLAAACCLMAHDRGGRPVLCIRLHFLEEANTRILKLYFESPQRLRLMLSESPGLQSAFPHLAGIMDGSLGRLAAAVVDSKSVRKKLDTAQSVPGIRPLVANSVSM